MMSKKMLLVWVLVFSVFCVTAAPPPSQGVFAVTQNSPLVRHGEQYEFVQWKRADGITFNVAVGFSTDGTLSDAASEVYLTPQQCLALAPSGLVELGSARDGAQTIVQYQGNGTRYQEVFIASSDAMYPCSWHKGS